MSAPVTADAWRLSTIDPPATPAKGMKFWVQTGSHWAIGQGYTISRVNSRSFYVAADGSKGRRAIPEWHAWLREREREGRVALDGHPMRSVRTAPLSAALVARSTTDGDDEEGEGGMARRTERDARILRAVRDVVRTYALTEETDDDEDGRRTFRLARRGAAYTVRVDPRWGRPPECDCPDAQRRFAGTGEPVFCEHVVATLVQRDELRHQLIDLFL